MKLDTLFDLSELNITTAEYLKQRTTKSGLRQRLLVIISCFTYKKEIPENLLMLLSKEAAQENTARWLKKFNDAFFDFDELTNTLHTQTINAIKQQKLEALMELQEPIELTFAQIQEVLEAPIPTQIDTTVLQSILEVPLVLMAEKDVNSFNREFYTHCQKYWQLLLTTLQSIEEVQQLNLVMQYLHKKEPLARAHIQELYDLYTKYLNDFNEKFLKIADSVEDPTLKQEDLRKALDVFEQKTKDERFEKIHKNSFAKQCLAQKTTPEHTALTILFLELVRENMKEFSESLLKDINDLRQEQGLMKTITFVSNSSINLPSTFSDDAALYSPPPSP